MRCAMRPPRAERGSRSSKCSTRGGRPECPRLRTSGRSTSGRTWEVGAMTEAPIAIEVQGVAKSFGEVVALDGLDLAAGLIGRPPVVLLDEPSTGLDPRSRQELWSSVEALRRDGTTVLLTTQYLEEADRLAQQIALVDRGRIAAQGTSAQLKAAIG